MAADDDRRRAHHDGPGDPLRKSSGSDFPAISLGLLMIAGAIAAAIAGMWWAWLAHH